jgi:hypothetical protein
MTTRATWLADVLRAEGLTVHEWAGWKTRGHGGFDDLGFVVWHHDGSPSGDSPGVPKYMLDNWDTAAAQLWVARDGTWHVLASGIAYHAGKTRPGKPHNSNSLGVETDHRPDEAWPPALLDSLRRGTAAILRKLGTKPAPGLEFHKTICAPVGRKTDPDGLDLPAERLKVGALMSPAAARTATPTPEDDMPLSDEDVQRVAKAAAALVRKDIVTLLRGDATHPYSLESIAKAVGVKP